MRMKWASSRVRLNPRPFHAVVFNSPSKRILRECSELNQQKSRTCDCQIIAPPLWLSAWCDGHYPWVILLFPIFYWKSSIFLFDYDKIGWTPVWVDVDPCFFVVIFKCLEDKKKILDQGPWFWGWVGLLVKPWFPNFNPLTMLPMTTLVWVRFPVFPFTLPI